MSGPQTSGEPAGRGVPAGPGDPAGRGMSAGRGLRDRAAAADPAADPRTDPGRDQGSDQGGDPVYLAGLHLHGRRVVLVGAGRVVARRLSTLRAAGAVLDIVAPQAHPHVAAAAAAQQVRWQRRDYAPGDLDGAWYAMAATDDPAVNAAVVAEAESRRVFCVRADAGPLGQAVTPASGRRGRVQVAVTTGGDYRLARRLRDELLSRLPH